MADFLTEFIQNTGGGPAFPQSAPRRDYGFENLPFSNTQLGQFVAPMMTPYLTSQMQQSGYTPMGLSGRNMLDTMRAMQTTAQMDATVRAAAQMERSNWMRTAQGIHQMATYNPATGMSDAWTDQTAQAAGTLVSGMVSGAPMLADTESGQAFLRAMGGSRGSATLMTRAIAESGRYRLDPITGRTGTSLRSDLLTAHHLQQTLFNRPDWAQQTAGFSQDQVGEAIAGLSARGLLEPSGSARDRMRNAALVMQGDTRTAPAIEQAMQAAGLGGRSIDSLNDSELQKLSKNPDMQLQMRVHDADRMRQSFQKYSKALAAVRDIFGDAGKPNAPMQEILAAMDSLTQNSSHMMDPGKLSSQIRQMHQLAKSSGVGIAGMFNMTQSAAGIVSRLQGMGIDVHPTMVNEVALAGMAGMQAYGNAGLSGFGWGSHSKEQYAQAEMIRTAKGAASATANQLGAVMRVADKVGFEKGSRGEALVAAIKAGEGSFVDPASGKRVDITSMQNSTLQEIVAGSTGGAVTADAFSIMLTQNGMNQEQIGQYNIGGIAKRGQVDEIFEKAAGRIGHATETTLGKYANKKELAELASATTRITRGMNKVDPAAAAALMKSDGAFKPLVDRLRADGKTEDQIDRILRAQALGTYGAVDEYVSTAGDSGYQTGAQVYQAGSPEAIKATNAAAAQAHARAVAAEQMTDVGRGSAAQRMVDAIQSGRSVKEAMLETIGGIPNQLIRDRIQAHMDSITDREEALTDADRKVLEMPEDTTEQREAKRQALESNPRLRARTAAMRAMHEELQNIRNQQLGDETGRGEWIDKDDNQIYNFQFNDKGELIGATGGRADQKQTDLTPEEAKEKYEKYRKETRAEIAAKAEEAEAKIAEETAPEKTESKSFWSSLFGGSPEKQAGGGTSKIVIEGTLTMDSDGRYRLNGRGGAPVSADK